MRCWVWLAIGLALALSSACSGDPQRSSNGGGSGQSGASGLSGGGLSGSGGVGIDNPDQNTGGGGAGGALVTGGTLGEGQECAGETQGAKPIELDMYVMLDRSGSMLGPTADGTTKWDAVRQALIAFASDDASAGLGVGLQYFPLGKAGVPERCGNDEECTLEGGVCLNTACAPRLFGGAIDFSLCITDADCPANSAGCQPYGVCELSDTTACFDLTATGCRGSMAGACIPAEGECTGYATCDYMAYGTPAVPIATLPGNEMALVTDLMNALPIGLTPTPSALDGAIVLATQQAIASPERRSIVVLATDGFPTDCLPATVMTELQSVQAVADIAAAGLSSTPSIRTYVIGVFGPEEPNAQLNLDIMAEAGGTETAFIVDSSGDVASQFIAALNEIRAGTLQCELRIPEAPANQTLSYDRVNIELTSSGTMRTLLYVENEAGCAGAELGWYYDLDPANGAIPTTIRICPSSCSEIQALGGDATLEIRLGCATLRPD